MDAYAIEVVRSHILRQGAATLHVDDLQESDLPLLGWAGSPLHIESGRKALARVPGGEVEYLVARAPDGSPVAKGGLEYADARGPGKIYQLATHPDLQNLGIGTHLVHALEDRVRARGFDSAWLGVEPENPARRLYERLGYQVFADESDGWATEDANGRRYWREALLVLMHHTL